MFQNWLSSLKLRKKSWLLAMQIISIYPICWLLHANHHFYTLESQGT